MKQTIEIKSSDDRGNEITHTLPARFVVCSRCEGHGTHLTPSIGEHAYTAEEFAEAFSDEEQRVEYFKRGGIYDETCHDCKGVRVVLEVDRDACMRDIEQHGAGLRAHYKAQQDDRDYRALCESERRAGC
jgi:hypothetical protein